MEAHFFISHAGEDKADVAKPLAVELQSRGFIVWYDEFILKVGDSLRKKIDEGLKKSKFGIVILSRDFFKKEWPQVELNGLASREIGAGVKVILPVWHAVTIDDVRQASPMLADKYAVRWSDGVQTVADQIIRASGLPLRGSTVPRPSRTTKDLIRKTFGPFSKSWSGREYGHSDWESVTIVEDEDPDKEITALVDIVSNFGRKAITEGFWVDLVEILDRIPEPMAILVTEHPIVMKVAGYVPGTNERVAVRYYDNSPWMGFDEIPVVMCDSSCVDDAILENDLLAARQFMKDYATDADHAKARVDSP